MTQVLPADETFAAPDWAEPTSGYSLVRQSPPWFYWYIGFSPSTDISTSATDATSGAVYPMRPDGYMGGKGTSALLRPGPSALTAIPCLMTDTNGTSYDNTLRSILCREEASFNYNDQDIKAVFGIEVVGGATQGFAHSGTAGSSPSPGGRLEYPSSPVTSGNLLKNMGSGKKGSWRTGGAMNAMGSDSSTINPWPAWQGNAVYFRAGSGASTVTNGAISDTDEVKRLWYYSGVDHYAFVAYPQTVGGGVTTNPDLYVELWQITYTSIGSSGGNTARLLVKQTCSGCVDRIDFRQPFSMRVKIQNDASSAPGPYPEIQAFIGPYTDLNGEIQPEAQCFKTNVLDSTNTFTYGANITHTTATGVVSDRHANKRVLYDNRTIGVATATDQMIDVSLGLNASATEPVYWQVHTGIYSLESKSIPSSGAAVVRYREEWSRVVSSGTPDGFSSIVNPIQTSVTGVQGVQINGMFTFDGYAQQYPTTLVASNLNLDLIRRLMLWTDGQADQIAPNDHVLLDYDGTTAASGTDLPYYVTRSFIQLRPSTQLFNHHRKLEFQAGAETGEVSRISYEIGIHLRGYFDGYTTNGLGCWLAYVTDGDGTITYGTVTVGYREHIYSDQNPDAGSSAVLATHVVARKVWATGTAAGFPALFNGSWHSLDFSARAYTPTTSPESPGVYLVEIDGAKIELNDAEAPHQSSTVTPYTIIEPSPRVGQGRAEGFWFQASVPEYNVGDRSFNPAKVRKWTEEALVADPGVSGTGADSMASIPVVGEGTPTGSLNLSAGALGIAGGGVWDVDALVEVQISHESRSVQFDSGHKYTSPLYSQARRRWAVGIGNMDLSVFQSLLAFYNSHNGPETPFTFRVPVLNDGTDVGSVAEVTEDVFGWFSSDGLTVIEKTYQTYDVNFSIVELLIP